MNFEYLANFSAEALFEIEKLSKMNGSDPVLSSIKSQMQFIYDSAIARKNPLDLISNDSPFTYGVLASREFSSPEEVEIKKRLDKVTELLSFTS